MSNKTILAIASAVLLSASGAAIAADNSHSMGNGQTSVNGEVTPRVNAEQPVTPEPAGPSYLKGIRNAELIGPGGDQSLLGGPVLDAMGHQIGEISRITPDGVVIGIGQKLGLGAHEVLVEPDALTATREHGTLAVISSLNEDQLQAMPAYNPAPAGMRR